jgi:hypothetical protein
VCIDCGFHVDVITITTSITTTNTSITTTTHVSHPGSITLSCDAHPSALRARLSPEHISKAIGGHLGRKETKDFCLANEC